MTQYADDLAASRSPLCDDELVAYLLAGLDEEYNSMFIVVVARVDPISPSDLYAQLLSFEQHTHLQDPAASGQSSSAMMVSHGRGSSGGGTGGPGRGHSHGRGRGRSSSYSRRQCQVCLKIRHTTNNCWHRFEEDYVLEPLTTAATPGPGTDDAWYTDSRAMDHITGEPDQFTMHEPYTSTDQIHTANDSSMEITRIGTSFIPTSSHDRILNKVLHVPSTHKNLIYVHRFTLDNDTYIEFHPFFFHIKDRKTRKVLLLGPCRGGLYPLPSSTSKFWKFLFHVIKIPVDSLA
jgi:hypothetical protein